MKPKISLKYIGLIAVIMCSAGSVLGWTSDGFLPENTVCRSSDIVVTDTNGVVEEVWLGSVKVGSTIDIEKLGISARVTYSPGEHFEIDGEGRTKEVPNPNVEIEASRMILFLQKSDDGIWSGATLNIGEETRYAVVWFVDGALWTWNPCYMHPSQFSLLPEYTDFNVRTLDDLKEYATTVSSIQITLEKTNKISDEKTRAEHLAEFVTEDCLSSLSDALDYLSSCGTAALPTFRLLLFDNNRLQRHRYIMDSLVKACDKEAKPLLVDIIKDEISYWQKKRDLLEEGWGHGSAVTQENGHYTRLEHALRCYLQLGVSSDDHSLLQLVSDTISCLPRKASLPPRKSNFDDDYRMKVLIDELLDMSKSERVSGKLSETKNIANQPSEVVPQP
jgi:hypothetical protein